MSKPKTLIGTSEACIILQRSRATVTRYVISGQLRCLGRLTGPNGALIFDESEVRQFATVLEARQPARASA